MICQFASCFTRKIKAYRRPRGLVRKAFLFHVWICSKETIAGTVTTALESVFPQDPPRFLARTPHGYYDHEIIKRDLAHGGFTASPEIITLPARSRAESFRTPAIAYCQGTPLRSEIEAREASRLGEATAVGMRCFR